MAEIAPWLWQQFSDENGVPYSGYQVFFYESGTAGGDNTKKNVFTDETGDNPQANPMVLNSAGMPPTGAIYFDTGSYDMVVAPPADTDPPVSPVKTLTGLSTSGGQTGIVDTIADLVDLSEGAYDMVNVIGYYLVTDQIEVRQYYWSASSTATDNGGTVITPQTSPASGRWLLKYEDTLNPKWFGAYDDGSNASTTTTAINSLKTVLTTGTILFSEGSYAIDASISTVIGQNLVMNKGASFTAGSAVNVTINGNFEKTLDTAFGTNITAVFNANKVAMRPEWWGALGDGSNDDTAAISSALAAGDAIYFTPGNTFAYTSMTIGSNKTVYSDGAILQCTTLSEDDIDINAASNVEIYGIIWEFENNDSCFNIKGDSTNITIRDCTVRPVTGSSPVTQPSNVFYLWDCDGVNIKNNYVSGCGYQVIQKTGERPVNVLVHGNKFIDCKNDSVLQNNDSDSGIVYNWICTDNTVDQSGNGLAYGQTETRGIGFTSIIGGTIANNTFINVKGDSATHLENVHDIIVEGNTYIDNFADVLHSGTTTRQVLYVTVSAGTPSGTLTFSSGGTCSIVWYDSDTARIYINAITGSAANGDTFTTSGGSGAGTVNYIDPDKVSARISNNLFYKTTASADWPSCVQLNSNNGFGAYVIVTDNTFNADDNTAYDNSAITAGFCPGASITGNLIKGFYYGIVGGGTGSPVNVTLDNLSILGNTFKRNTYNIYNQGAESEIVVKDNIFWDGITFFGNSSSGTLGFTKSQFVGNIVKAGSLTFEAATFEDNRFYNNDIDSSVTLTAPSSIFDVYLHNRKVRKISYQTIAISTGTSWVTGNTVTGTITSGFEVDPATVIDNVYYAVNINPGSTTDLKGIVKLAYSNGTTGQVEVSLSNVSGATKTVGASGFITVSVIQMVI